MSRSFGIVDEKLFEADFFLEKFKSCDKNIFDARFYFSAFISAARSVTFCIQASIHDLDGFDDWYAEHQQRLRNDKLASFFVKARNDSQKVGFYHVNGGSFPSSSQSGKYHFSPFFNKEGYGYYPSESLEEAGTKFMAILLEIVYDCYRAFGPYIDPEQFWMLRNLKKHFKTIGDVAEHKGFPRNWLGHAEDLLEDINVERENIPLTNEKSEIDTLFKKYLNKIRDLS